MSFQILVADPSIIVIIYDTKVILEINYIFAVLESDLNSLDQLRESRNLIRIGLIINFTANGVGHKMILLVIRQYFDCFGQLPMLSLVVLDIDSRLARIQPPEMKLHRFDPSFVHNKIFSLQ
jgi:hypothetical protein